MTTYSDQIRKSLQNLEYMNVNSTASALF
jgi:hypothetical protein